MPEKYEAPELEVLDIGEDVILTSGDEIEDRPPVSYTTTVPPQ